MWDGYLIEVKRYCGGKHIGTEYVARTGKSFFRTDEMILPGELFQTMEEAELFRIFFMDKHIKIRPGELAKTKVVLARRWDRGRSGN